MEIAEKIDSEIVIVIVIVIESDSDFESGVAARKGEEMAEMEMAARKAAEAEIGEAEAAEKHRTVWRKIAPRFEEVILREVSDYLEAPLWGKGVLGGGRSPDEKEREESLRPWVRSVPEYLSRTPKDVQLECSKTIIYEKVTPR